LTQSRSGGRLVATILVAWLGAALALGASGLLLAARPPLPQLLVLALTAAVLLAGFRVRALREWALAVDVRALVALNLTRFVGAYFIVLFRRGELPFAFAVPGGWGDMLTAAGALVLLAAGRPDTGFRRGLYATWNLFGLLDILFVVATAARLGLTDPGSIQALLRLPLSLLPTFLVPLIIASHVLIFVRLRRDGRQLASSARVP
jgi:hypothetical protein